MKKILLTTAAAAVLATSSAYAMEDKFYVKAQAGWSKLDKDGGLPSNNDVFYGIGAGYHVMDNVRVDLTFDRFGGPIHKNLSKEKPLKVKGKVDTLMFNGFVDIFDVDMAKFFVGAGVGAGQVKVTHISKDPLVTPADVIVKVKQNYSLAFAGYVGASYEFTPGVTGELTYSYRDIGKTKKYGKDIKLNHYKGHHIGAGVRFDI